MLRMVEGLLHEPGERLRALFFNFRSNKSNQIRVAGVHIFNSPNAIRNRHSERSRGILSNQDTLLPPESFDFAALLSGRRHFTVQLFDAPTGKLPVEHWAFSL